MMKFIVPFAVLLFCSHTGFSQSVPIGQWRAYMPYINGASAATDGVTIYAGSQYSFFTYNVAEDEITTYSKVEGMSDVGIAHIGYDTASGYAIITYTNTNIDLFKNGTFYNIPDITLKSLTGAKTINHIYTENGTAYLSTSFGVVVLNLGKRETKETYSFVENNQAIEVRSFTAADSFFYAATSNGLFRANKNSLNLQAFSSWQKLDTSTQLRHIARFSTKILASGNDSLFVLEHDTLRFVYSTYRRINNIMPLDGSVWIAEFNLPTYSGTSKQLDMNLQFVDSFHVPGLPLATIALADNSVWVMDEYNGLGKRNNQGSVDYLNPNGPADASAFDILPYNGEVWVAHGSYNDNWSYIYNRAGVSRYKDGKWNSYNRYTVPELDDATDFIVLAKDPKDGTIYAGAYRSGLLIIKPDGSLQYLKENTGFLEPTQGDPGAYRVSGLAFDQNGVLWLTQAGAVHEIVAKTPQGNWIPFKGAASGIYAASVIIDDYNQKWYLTPSAGGGIAVYDDKGTPENPGDDAFARISTGEVSNIALSLAKDKNGAIWIGTNDGIGIINCPGEIFQGTCKVDRPIVQYDQFAGFLFQNERVNTIAVDGANRKWIGTNNGVWLVSPDGDKIIYRFTADNSPLPSNIVQKIAVDPVTGDVYMGTSQGLVSYRSTATEGGETNQNVMTFPNPVPSGYSGSIAIRGVSENADVRVTDIAGQLVFRTRAFGGQAVWNGLDYTGRRPQSGVYLIFVTNKDGSQTHVGKMVFME